MLCCHFVFESSSDIIRSMSLGTGLTIRPDLVVRGINLELGVFSDTTGCLSATVVCRVCETGFAGPSRSGTIDI